MKEPNLNKLSLIREYKLGIRYITADRAAYRYGKIDFGYLGKLDDGEVLRAIYYGWLPWAQL